MVPPQDVPPEGFHAGKSCETTL